MNHLTPEDIEAYRVGSLGQDASQHLRECTDCRSRLFGERLFDILLASVSGTPEPSTMEHPTSDSLFAYVEGELDVVEAARIEAHLRGCEACLTQALAAHRGSLDTETIDDEPPPELVMRVRQQIVRTTPTQTLGQLFLESLDRVVVRLTYRPSKGLKVFGAPLQAGLLAAQPADTVVPGRVPAASPVHLTIGTVQLALQGVRRGTEILLTITATNLSTGAPIADFAIERPSEQGKHSTETTNLEGQASITVPSGKTRLLFATDPASEIELHLVEEV